MEGIAFTVRGIPAPQGSKRHVGGGVLVESSNKVAPWRQDVRRAAADAMNGHLPFDGPLEVLVTFTLAKPRTVKREMPHVRPDLDKLVRSTLDALGSAGVYGDDSQVVSLVTLKVYGIIPGASIIVRVYHPTAEEVAA
jgi:Holliday junction resolvase RusA-like endonuclease